MSEDQAQRAVGFAVGRALERFCEEMDDEIRRGNLTAKEVKHALRSYPDFADGCEEYLRFYPEFYEGGTE